MRLPDADEPVSVSREILKSLISSIPRSLNLSIWSVGIRAFNNTRAESNAIAIFHNDAFSFLMFVLLWLSARSPASVRHTGWFMR